MQNLANKRILVTGCCGTVGSELLRQLLSSGADQPAEVIGIDNNESELFFRDQQYLSCNRAQFFLADVRDRDKLSQVAKGIDVIFHAAALKHVVMCERSPMDAVQTNILGVQNVIHAANEQGISKVCFTSSDKAVNPTNVMGTSKLMGERLMTAANSTKRGKGPLFSSTRFGNVLGSNGSVLPIFRSQIASGGPVTLTDQSMSRFIMSIEQAVSLVIRSTEMACGGDVFITKMPVIKIADLAAVMIEELAPLHGHDPKSVKVVEIGVKPGEKLYEELMSEEEMRRAVELKDYFAIKPAFLGLYHDIIYSYATALPNAVTNPYNSAHQTPLTRSELKEFLLKHNLLGAGVSGQSEAQPPAQRYWPGDKEERSS